MPRSSQNRSLSLCYPSTPLHKTPLAPSPSRPCPSFPIFFGKRQGKSSKKRGLFIAAEPLKSLEKKGKTLKKQKKRRKSPQGEKQGIPNNNKKKRLRKGRTGTLGTSEFSGAVAGSRGRKSCTAGRRRPWWMRRRRRRRRRHAVRQRWRLIT